MDIGRWREMKESNGNGGKCSQIHHDGYTKPMQSNSELNRRFSQWSDNDVSISIELFFIGLHVSFCRLAAEMCWAFFCVALFLYCRNLEPMWFICVIHFFGLFCVAFPIGLRTVMNILPAFLLPWFNEIEPRPAFFEMLCSIFTPEWLYLLSSGLRPPFFGRCLQQTPIKTLHQVKWKQHTHTHNI